jgi:SAM-dependent methyltransferase
MRLNIASATNVFPYDGWINYDRESVASFLDICKTYPTMYINNCPEYQRNIILYLQSGGNIDFRIQDLRDGFPQHTDNSIDGIYLGQMIEHLNPIYETPKFLNECFRMLKPGGIIRITTPDLDLLLQHYIDNKMDKFIPDQPEFYRGADPSSQLAFLMYGACGPNCTWDNYEGHMFLFSRRSMTSMLSKSGFNNIVFYDKSGTSIDPIMAKHAFDAGMSHSFITEAVK